jgi:hypothetical protein
LESEARVELFRSLNLLATALKGFVENKKSEFVENKSETVVVDMEELFFPEC